ncbi:MAG: DUF4301 family protein [Flavobacteriales bacterium]
MRDELQASDLAYLSDKGIDEEEARRQCALLSGPPPKVNVLRPCVPGDGIERFSDGESSYYAGLYDAAKEKLSAIKFVPASGSASRMFSALHDRESTEYETFFKRMDEFAFYPLLRKAGKRNNEDLLAYLLEEGGLGYAHLPKGMIPFHRYGDQYRTAFEEHLFEAVAYASDGVAARVHFTVSGQQRDRVERHLADRSERVATSSGIRIDISLSEQLPSTDTLALDSRGRLLRNREGRLHLRPAGHGALLPNLHQLHADIIFIKNIDNVRNSRQWNEMIRWKKALAGYLLKLKRELPDDRPIRVCGMVANEGEPGGGPFWVDGPEGESRQLVEKAQINRDDKAQRAVLERATHFNPVDLVCSITDRRGRVFDLNEFCDRKSWIISEKPGEEGNIRVLERPGLWNGCMAGWRTFFVEVPLLTFSPVKTVCDLLRQEHQNS